MMSVRKLVIAATVAAGVVGTGSLAQAQWGKCNGPMCNQPRYPTLAAAFGAGQKPLPTFQAAPWYLYWPYDSHFLTPAPVVGPWYGPPTPGNFPVNPYFPAPQYGPYGPIPGGPAPYYGAPPAGYGIPPGGVPVQGGPMPMGPLPGGPGGPIPPRP
jgi:hypothetical protein